MNYKLKFPKPSKRKKALPKVTEKESSIQRKIEKYLDLRQVAYIRLPGSLMNEIFGRFSRADSRDKAFISNYLKGLPDLTIFHPTKKIGPYSIVLPLELKTERGKLTTSQMYWQRKCGTIVTRGWKETLAEVDKFLDIR